MTARPLHHHAYTNTNSLPATKGAKLLHDVLMKAHLGLDRDLTSPFGSCTARRARQARYDPSDWEAGGLGNFRIGETFHLAQRQGAAILQWKTLPMHKVDQGSPYLLAPSFARTDALSFHSFSTRGELCCRGQNTTLGLDFGYPGSTLKRDSCPAAMRLGSTMNGESLGQRPRH